MMELVPLNEGFLTYGGMSVREMEAVAVGIQETMDEDVVSQDPLFITFMTDEFLRLGVPSESADMRAPFRSAYRIFSRLPTRSSSRRP